MIKRQFIAGVMGLALAGCAHSRSEVTKGPDGTNPVGPVGLKPVPSLSDTINQGTGNAAMAQSALGDPSDPRWKGVAPSPSPSGSSPRMAATGEAPAQPNWSRTPQVQPAAAPDRLTARPSPSSLAANPPAEFPDRMTAQTVSPNDPRNQPAAAPDGLNPTPTLDAAASAAAATMAAMAPGIAASTSSPGAPPAENAATSPSMAADMPPYSPTAPGVPTNSVSVPYTLERPGGPMPGMLSQTGGPAAPSAVTPANVAGRGMPPMDGQPGSDPTSPTLAAPSSNGLEPVGAPPSPAAVAARPTGSAAARSDAAVSPSAGHAGPTNGAGARAAKPSPDPLLGPNPDLMPELPPLPDVGPAKTDAAGKPPTTPATAAPAPSPSPASRPDDLPTLGPATGPVDAPPGPASSGGANAPAPPPTPAPPAGGASAPPDLGPPSVDNRAGGVGPESAVVKVADLPPLEPVASAGQLSGGLMPPTAAPAAAAASSSSVRRVSSRRDGRILRASLQKPVADVPEPEIPGSWRQASMTAAKVGDEIITIRDLHSALNEHCKRKDIPYNRLPREQKHEICAALMKELINQSLLLQEAKHTIKSQKMYDQFTEEADRFWREDQLPQLEVEFAAENESQLREKLKEHGRSFDTISLMTRRGWMADAFLHAKLKDKIKAELPELLKYYKEHMHDNQYDRPAQINWREIVAETGPQATREQARRKIESIHQALSRGADFAALARAQSEGPSRSREQGGLMQTSPGSYGVPSVNEALGSLAIGQVSPILEGPSSFHIVRVDSRRAAGPAPFEELQDEIRTHILNKKFQAERTAYIQKLWDESFVSTFLDDTNSDPRRVAR
jgi:peptidyl-prolyl cis-trans isomerase SurA